MTSRSSRVIVAAKLDVVVTQEFTEHAIPGQVLGPGSRQRRDLFLEVIMPSFCTAPSEAAPSYPRGARRDAVRHCFLEKVDTLADVLARQVAHTCMVCSRVRVAPDGTTGTAARIRSVGVVAARSTGYCGA